MLCGSGVTAHSRYQTNAVQLPHPCKKGPMGDVPYIGPRLGGGGGALLLLISGTVTNQGRGRPAIGPILHDTVDGCRNSNGWFMRTILQTIDVRSKNNLVNS